MKPPFRALLVLAAGFGPLAPTRAWAQTQTFPNSGLDAWAPRGGIEAPTNWQTTDDVAQALLGARIPTNTVVKTAVVHGGAFAAQLQTQNLLGQGQIPGLIFLGNSVHGGANLAGGLPFTARPASVQFYYQLSGAQALADSAAMAVQLTRRVNGVAQVVAQGGHLFTALAGSYVLVTVPLRYRSGVVPDSLSLAFSSGNAKRITVGTVLRIDDITLLGTVTATRDAVLNAALTVAPNPSPDGRYQLITSEPGLLNAPLAVLDATGRVVRREPAASPAATTARPLDLSELPAGIYTVQLFTHAGLVTRKLSR